MSAQPPAEGDPDARIVPVFRTTDATVLPIVKSLLESAGIDYYVQGEEALGLIPLGRMGSSVSRASLGAIVHVNDEDAASVRDMLADLEQDLPDVGGVVRGGVDEDG